MDCDAARKERKRFYLLFTVKERRLIHKPKNSGQREQCKEYRRHGSSPPFTRKYTPRK